MLIAKKEVQSTIDKINIYLGKCLWMDFVLGRANGGEVEIVGAMDQTYNNFVNNYEIKLIFEQPYFISCLSEWSLDTTRPFIQLCSINEAVAINTKYQVGQSDYIFKINAEGFESYPIFIVAKGIDCKILNYDPFQN